jgi:Zn-dependent metalloprotease
VAQALGLDRERLRRADADGRGSAGSSARTRRPVHYGTDYDNAFWDNAGHMFFGDGDGDGDGKLLTETPAGIDVIGHELTHGVTQHEANLVYSGQSGALNESISDVFGIQVKQMALGQDVTTSDWLIGADIVGPELKPALRSMVKPGTANAHDDQPADMDGYVAGGDVHTNSGIPTGRSPRPRSPWEETPGMPRDRSGTRL